MACKGIVLENRGTGLVWYQSLRFRSLRQVISTGLLVFLRGHVNKGCRRRCGALPRTAHLQNPDGMVGEGRGQDHWSLSWQLNERSTHGVDLQRSQLVALLVAEKVGLEVEEVDCLIGQFCRIVPEGQKLVGKRNLECLVHCVADLRTVAETIVWLRQEFPTLDIGQAAASCSEILMWTHEQVSEASKELESVLGNRENVNALLEKNPRMIIAQDAKDGIKTIDTVYSLSQGEAVKLVIDHPQVLLLCIQRNATSGSSDTYEPMTQSRQD